MGTQVKSLVEAEFLRWAEKHGLALDERHPQLAILQFRPHSEFERFWCIPDRPERRPFFFAAMLELAGPWDCCFAWRHCGSWPSKERLAPLRINDNVEYELLKGIGIPLGTADVLQFQRDSLYQLISLLLITSIFGWSVGEDLYVVPDSARQVLKISHHDVVHVEFRNEDDLNTWIAGMSEKGFPLPDEPPDETFKRPSWMS